MTILREYDKMNRLTNVVSSTNAVALSKFRYGYNSANQRTIATALDGSYWIYGYDSLGQVTSGKRYWSDGTRVAGQQPEYTFDDIGNRTFTKTGGDQNGANLRLAAYSPNSLNQYTSRTVPGYAEINGTAANTATVYVGSQQAVRKADFFRGEAVFNNNASPIWANIDVAALQLVGSNPTNVAKTNGNVFLPQSPETFSYDSDGDITSDGRWTYTWDAENRLIRIESAANAPAGSKLKLEFVYDWQGRRIQKTVSTWTGTAYQVSSQTKFLYDGWNLVAILDGGNNILQSFTWGTDASGSMQGAGGVGGLISIRMHSGPLAGSYFYCYDGNWNVAALVNSVDGSVAARYEYGPFGELIRATGPLARINSFRFSTKYTDDETDLLYYGYRYYIPSIGRWLSRDPSEESGGANLYGNRNDLVDTVDLFGLSIVCNCDLVQYLSENGITGDMYDVSGNTYTAKDDVECAIRSDVQEILWTMLKDSRTFTAKGLLVDSLKKNVLARQKVVAATALWRGPFPAVNGQWRMNPAFWSTTRPLVVLSGKRSSDAINDAFSNNGGQYVLGCRFTTHMVLLKGILDAIGAADFNNALVPNGESQIDSQAFGKKFLGQATVAPGGASPTLRDWVPGDKGNIKGNGLGLTAGENIIYLGRALFWGRPHGTDTLDGWIAEVTRFSGSADEVGERIFPGVGLQGL